MADATRFQFTNPAVPKAYEEFLVPRLFEPWAKLLLDEVKLRADETVLDIATGPGTVARLAALRVGPRGRIVATDIAPPMLDIARAKPTLDGAAAIDYVESSAAPLGAPSGTFDAVLCQQGLQFFPDRSAALAEMRRVLRPGGRLLVLEFSKVWEPLKPAYDAYSFGLLPRLGKLVANDAEAYRYLAESIRMHPDQAALKAMMEQAGLERVEYFNLAAGVVALHRGYKL